MTTSFHVEVTKFEILPEIDGAWSSDDYRALLDEMDYGDTTGMAEAELREMCLLSMQELKPQAAAALVLSHHLGDRLTGGQHQNSANEMLDEKLWEEFADLSLHELMFNVGSLLYAALPDSFPEPDAVRVSLTVTARNPPAKDILSQPLHESFLVRLLADGMGEDAVLHRLFNDQLSGGAFPEADKIVWIVCVSPLRSDTIDLQVTSSGYWLDALREAHSFDSSARPDTSTVK